MPGDPGYRIVRLLVGEDDEAHVPAVNKNMSSLLRGEHG